MADAPYYNYGTRIHFKLPHKQVQILFPPLLVNNLKHNNIFFKQGLIKKG